MKATIALLGAISAVLACSPSSTKDTTRIPDGGTTVCDELRGASYRSVNHYPGALGPDGAPVVDYQYVSFSKDMNTYKWTYEDMVFTGFYDCNGTLIKVEGAPFTNSRPFTATLDAVSGVLTWNSVDFTRQP